MNNRLDESDSQSSAEESDPYEPISDGHATFDGAPLSRRPEFWCAIVIVGAFFLPWLELGPIISVAGYQLPKAARFASELGKAFGEGKSASAGSSTNWMYLVYLVPLASVVAIVEMALGRLATTAAVLAATVPLAEIAFWATSHPDKVGDTLGVGVLFSVVAAVTLLILVLGDVPHRVRGVASHPRSARIVVGAIAGCLVATAIGVAANERSGESSVPVKASLAPAATAGAGGATHASTAEQVAPSPTLQPQPAPSAPAESENLHAAKQMVDKMADALNRMVIDVEAAGNDTATIKEIGAKFKKNGEAMKAEGEALQRVLTDDEKKYLESYGREKIAPLMGKLTSAMQTAQAAQAGGAQQKRGTPRAQVIPPDTKKVEAQVKVSLGGLDGSDDGDGSNGDIAKKVASRAGAVKSCYEAALLDNPAVSGKVKVSFTVGTAGTVTDVTVSGADGGFKDCIEGKFKSIRGLPILPVAKSFSQSFVFSKS